MEIDKVVPVAASVKTKLGRGGSAEVEINQLGSDHRENHLEPRDRLEGVRLARRHENHFAALQAVGVAGNHNFRFN